MWDGEESRRTKEKENNPWNSEEETSDEWTTSQEERETGEWRKAVEAALKE